MDLAYTALAASMLLLEGNLVFYVPPIALPNYQDELACYEASRIPLAFDAKISPETGTGFLALNPGEGYGRLQALEPDGRPHPRDVVIYEALPNELPRVAGIVSTVPQTPLSHVNLRAVQDGIPNAFIRDALDKPGIDVSSHGLCYCSRLYGQANGEQIWDPEGANHVPTSPFTG